MYTSIGFIYHFKNPSLASFISIVTQLHDACEDIHSSPAHAPHKILTDYDMIDRTGFIEFRFDKEKKDMESDLERSVELLIRHAGPPVYVCLQQESVPPAIKTILRRKEKELAPAYAPRESFPVQYYVIDATA